MTFSYAWYYTYFIYQRLLYIYLNLFIIALAYRSFASALEFIRQDLKAISVGPPLGLEVL